MTQSKLQDQQRQTTSQTGSKSTKITLSYYGSNLKHSDIAIKVKKNKKLSLK